MENGRAGCYTLPAERVAMLLYLKHTYPTGWKAIWQRIVRAWRHA